MAIFTALTSALGAGAAGTASAATGAGAAAAGTGAAAAGATTGATSAVGGLGTALQAVGVGAGVYGQFAQHSAQKKAEQIRKSQMEIETKRQRRQIVRQALVSRADALSSATSQGAAEGSGFAGGAAQISAQRGFNLSGANASQDLGRAMFSANKQISSAGTVAGVGSGMQSLGQALVKNQEPIGRLGTYYV